MVSAKMVGNYEPPKRKNPYEDALKRRLAAQNAAQPTKPKIPPTNVDQPEDVQKRKKVGY
jgi:hypothetical protein